MGFRTQRTLVCDRCGASIPVDDEVTASFEFSGLLGDVLKEGRL